MKDIVKYEDFEKIEILVGTILEVKANEKARKPAYVLKIDFGEKFGIKQPDGSIKTANELLADSDGGPEALVQIAKGVDPIADKEESKGIFGFFGGD